MNCPHCGKNIGGHVELGSVGYQRVSKGLCPHCGRSMPSGYKVGFQQSTLQWTSVDEYERKYAKALTYPKKVGLFSNLGVIGLFIILYSTFNKGIGWIVLSIVISIAYRGVAQGVSYLVYDYANMYVVNTTNSTRYSAAVSEGLGPGLMIFWIIVSILLFIFAIPVLISLIQGS